MIALILVIIFLFIITWLLILTLNTKDDKCELKMNDKDISHDFHDKLAKMESTANTYHWKLLDMKAEMQQLCAKIKLLEEKQNY